MKDPREVPNGCYKRRNRCVVCNKLTWSTISMGYPKDEKWFNGIHCYVCYDDVIKQLN